MTCIFKRFLWLTVTQIVGKARGGARLQPLLDFSKEDQLKIFHIITEMLLASQLNDFMGTKIILLLRKPLICSFYNCVKHKKVFNSIIQGNLSNSKRSWEGWLNKGERRELRMVTVLQQWGKKVNKVEVLKHTSITSPWCL